MFGRETRMLLRHYLEHGTTKSALARKLGVSRDKIHRWIRDGDLDRDLDETAAGHQAQVDFAGLIRFRKALRQRHGGERFC